MSKRKQNHKIDPNLRLADIQPKNEAQQRVFDLEGHGVLHGAAGTGKSFLTSFLGYRAVLRKQYDKLIYLRSAVPTRDIGFLPGTEKEKTEVYERPYQDIAIELFDRGDAYETLKASGAAHFTTTSHIRGITLNNAVIIVDECQNMTYQELDSVMTRIGTDCRVFFCGDYYQRDLKNTGIREFYEVLKTMDEFEFINFTIDDVVRSSLVKSYLKAKYEQGNFEQSDLSTSRSRISDMVARKADLQNSELQQSDDADSDTELCGNSSGFDEPADRSR